MTKVRLLRTCNRCGLLFSENDLEKYLSYIHPDYSVFGEGDVYLHEGKAKERIDYADYLGRASGVRTFMHQPKVTRARRYRLAYVPLE